MKKLQLLAVLSILSVAVLTGCASTRLNITYDAGAGDAPRLERAVTGTILPVADMREETRIYPKQVIKYVSYGGDITYDINDRTAAEVVTDSLASELQRAGVKLAGTDIAGPLDRDSASRIKKELSAKYPDIKAAFGAKVTDFIATSERGLLTTKLHVAAAIQFYVLDVGTGELLWSDYKAEWDKTALSSDRDALIKQLDEAVATLMHKTVRDNASLVELLKKMSSR